MHHGEETPDEASSSNHTDQTTYATTRYNEQRDYAVTLPATPATFLTS